MERNNAHTPHDSVDVFDDEFAVDGMDRVADGFAPGRIHSSSSSSSNTNNNNNYSGHDDHDDDDDDDEFEEEPAIRSVAAQMVETPTTQTPTATTASPLSRFAANRNSMRKSRDMQNPFRSVEDEDDDQSLSGRTPSIRSQSTVAYAPGNYHRSLSSTSSRAFAPSTNPLSGPSHPYAMYPQGTNLARTPSISTVSTARAPQRPLMAEQGPTHPYSMYPQNVSEDLEETQDHGTPDVQSHIPVGFPGRTQAFRRQQGPEGEEHDIIGVDGHTEQLPPYSEYPEDGAPKHIVIPQPLAVAASSSRTQLSLPLIPNQPQSMADAGTRESSQIYTNMEQMESNESSNAATAKSWREKSWREKRKTKFCGIPFWWLLLSLGVLAFIATVLGGAIGGFMSAQKRENEKHNPKGLPSSTSLLDASPIPTSSMGAPPPTGTYALTLGMPEETRSACLTNQSYAAAWDCNIPGPPALAISIQETSTSSGSFEGACLFDTSDYDDYTNFSYGTQTPSTSFSQFIAVQDNDDPDRGPAYYFQALYDKLVILPQSSLPSPYSQPEKRSPWFTGESDWSTRKQIAAGEKPWFCYWNGTMLEGFIYSANYTDDSNSSAVNPASITSSLSSTPTSSSSYFTTTVSGVSTTATLTAASATSATPSPYSSTNAERGPDGDAYDELPSFGRLVKIEERRVQSNLAPYCQLMQILDDGTAGAVSDADGNPIRITLGETDPTYGAYQSSSSSSSGSSRRDRVAGGCHCQWWSEV
ncbi:hypothetical protein AAFC00_005893 [Neodothiora populina]|uniref:DUF7820 domain-containing protein n=1 Tax=Neodothiora populina TaxID=2781224 RepID=A0ABR3P684_9PEZI